jgi:hypothetical protein
MYLSGPLCKLLLGDFTRPDPHNDTLICMPLTGYFDSCLFIFFSSCFAEVGWTGFSVSAENVMSYDYSLSPNAVISSSLL